MYFTNIYVTQNYLLRDYWATQNLLHSQEHIDWITNFEDLEDEVKKIVFFIFLKALYLLMYN